MGSYKVNSAYAAITDAREGGFSEELFCKISKLGVPPKVQCLMRRIFHHSFLPLKSNLTKRRIIIDHMLCPFCHSQEKSQQHLLFTCPASSQVWNTYYSWLNELTVLPSATAHFWQNMGCASSNREKKSHDVYVNCCGVEYLEDDCVFKQASFDFDKIMQDIIFYVWFWLKNIAAINICSFSQW